MSPQVSYKTRTRSGVQLLQFSAQTMNSSGCENTDLTVNWTDPSVVSVNYTNALPWLISRLRPFLYLSDPREESFETVDRVPDYQTEVSLFKISIVESN